MREVLITAVLTFALTYLFFSYSTKQQKEKQKDEGSKAEGRKSESNRDRNLNAVKENLTKEALEEIANEQLARNIAFLGYAKLQMVRKSFVIIVGLGGVGSHAATMLVRNGVGKIRFIDFDQVTVSSLNRHSNATREDVGLPKTQVLKNFLLKVAPFCEIETREAMFTGESAADLLDGNPDYVLDCIDNIDTKVALLRFCHEKKIKVMCSMGAGAKGDPSRLLVADLSLTSADPLSRAVRRGLKKYGIESGIPTIFSSEVPKIGLLPLDEEQSKDAQNYQVIPDFRVRILPVLGPMPAMFGNAMAIFVLQELTGNEVPQLHARVSLDQARKYLQQFQMRERDLGTDLQTIAVTAEDVAYISEELWRHKSVISGQIHSLCLMRWDRSVPCVTHNLVLMTNSEAKKHLAMTSLNEYPAEIREKVERILAEEKNLAVWK